MAETKREVVQITNLSKQSIPIHVKAPKNVDFYIGERSMYIAPGKSATLPKNRLYDTQISRLQKRRCISVKAVGVEQVEEMKTVKPRVIRRAKPPVKKEASKDTPAIVEQKQDKKKKKSETKNIEVDNSPIDQ